MWKQFAMIGKSFDNWITSSNIDFLSFINAKIYTLWEGVQMAKKFPLQMAKKFLHVHTNEICQFKFCHNRRNNFCMQSSLRNTWRAKQKWKISKPHGMFYFIMGSVIKPPLRTPLPNGVCTYCGATWKNIQYLEVCICAKSVWCIYIFF